MAQRSNRRSLNLISEVAITDRVSYIAGERVDSIMVRSHLLQQRPNTLAQTRLSSSLFACNSAADNKFRMKHNGGVEVESIHR
jgi:hypothetical protein